MDYKVQKVLKTMTDDINNNMKKLEKNLKNMSYESILRIISTSAKIITAITLKE